MEHITKIYKSKPFSKSIMTKQKILNSKEIKKINKVLEERFGVTLPKERVYLMSEKDRLYISTRMIDIVDTDNIRVNSFGIYVLTMKDNTLRLVLRDLNFLDQVLQKMS